MNGTIRTLLCTSTLFVFAPAALGQKATSSGSTPRIAPGAFQVLDAKCAKSIRDQGDSTKCIQANSTATVGLLFPYPGVDNLFGGTAFVGGGMANHATGAGSAIAAGHYNSAAGGNASIGGGIYNSALGFSATIAGGFNNSAAGPSAAVGGGEINSAGGANGAVGGGFGNSAGGVFSTVGGGAFDSASNEYATVSGGLRNLASGSFSAVLGGADNKATGYFSLAAGLLAHATHDGSFVWGDGQIRVKTSSAPNQFNVYASGGARFFTDPSATAGVLLAAGGGSWSSVSDRASKENLSAVDVRDVLARVVALPVSTWNYKTQDDSIRHMGPMAQDFHAAFELGASDKLIDTIDSDGVALAAIQGLHELVEEQGVRLAQKDTEIAELRAELVELGSQVAELVRATQP